MSRLASHLRVVMVGGVRDAVRRRLFAVLAVLSVIFVALYATGLTFVWHEAQQRALGTNDVGIDERIVIASTFTGLALFAIHFLGAVVGAFLVIGTVRGDAELGVLQALLVRPLGRTTYLLGRFAAAAVVAAAYVALMVLACFVVSRVVTGWWPDSPWLAIARMSLASVGLVAVGLLGSVLMASAANGVTTFMVFGLALLGGLLDQLGEGISSPATRHVGQWVLRVFPFEAMYQWALDALTNETVGMERLVVTLGPFGGARSHDWGIVVGQVAFCAVLLTVASWRLRRLDL
ncbi:MAG: transporter permease subunit [Thermoleophilia bacterium]|nr:transporter permease subunit [Thermoleophilia bacterium]